MIEITQGYLRQRGIWQKSLKSPPKNTLRRNKELFGATEVFQQNILGDILMRRTDTAQVKGGICPPSSIPAKYHNLFNYN